MKAEYKRSYCERCTVHCYVGIMKLRIILFSLLVIFSATGNAVGVTNICKSDESITKFERLHKVDVRESGSWKNLTIELPMAFVEKYTLRSLNLNMYKTKIYERKGKSREQTRLVLVTPFD